jgi:hypothetical protein
MHIQADEQDGAFGGCRGVGWGRGRRSDFCGSTVWVSRVCRSSWCLLFVHSLFGARVPQLVARQPVLRVATHALGEQTPLLVSSTAILSSQHDAMNTQQMMRCDATTFAQLVFSILLFIFVSLMLTSCVGPEITDPDWRGRDVYNTMPPTAPAPPRQWDYRTWETLPN